MAVYQGKLFCGVLPSGRVLSYETGRCISRDYELPAGWVHLAAQRKSGTMNLYVDGKLVNEASSASLNIDNEAPLKIGLGQHDYFNGRMRDLMVHDRALTEAELAALAEKR